MSDPVRDMIARGLIEELDNRKWVKLRKAGNAPVVTIPKKWLNALGLKAGDHVKLDLCYNRIVLKRARTELL